MAKSKNSEPAPADGFTQFDDETLELPVTDPRDAEIERLKAELAAVKAGPTPPAAGQRFQVEVLHGPKAVVECAAGEYPFDAYCRATGVISSQNPPVISAVSADTPLGIVKV